MANGPISWSTGRFLLANGIVGASVGTETGRRLSSGFDPLILSHPFCVVSLGCHLPDVEPVLSELEDRLYLYRRGGREHVFEGYPVSDTCVFCLNRMDCERTELETYRRSLCTSYSPNISWSLVNQAMSDHFVLPLEASVTLRHRADIRSIRRMDIGMTTKQVLSLKRGGCTAWMSTLESTRRGRSICG
jgi:hypothetical protein